MGVVGARGGGVGEQKEEKNLEKRHVICGKQSLLSNSELYWQDCFETPYNNTNQVIQQI